MRSKITVRVLLAAALAAAMLSATAQADVFHMGAGDTSLTFVPIGNAGNVADPATGSIYGSVPYAYKMGTYDVTLAQYAQFLNAVAKTDTYGLYNSYTGTDFATQGISQSGSPGSLSYAVTGSAPGASNMPVFDVSWGDAARFLQLVAERPADQRGGEQHDNRKRGLRLERRN